MKRLVSIIVLCLALLFCIPALAAYYQVGDEVADFTVKLPDQAIVSLYQLLEEKDIVLINFWATWCPPCRMEFPYMQEAYVKYQNRVGLIALSIEPTDRIEVIKTFQKILDIESLPMAQDTSKIANRFDFEAIPTSIIIGADHTMLWQETGAIFSVEEFESLFASFLPQE